MAQNEHRVSPIGSFKRCKRLAGAKEYARPSDESFNSLYRVDPLMHAATVAAYRVPAARTCGKYKSSQSSPAST